MKHRLKDINFTNIIYSEPVLFEGSSLINLSILNEIIEFQTPKMLIESLKDNYITLKILPNEACKIFYSKIIELEKEFSNHFPNKINNNIFKENIFTVKIPFSYSKPNVKIYLNDSPFNYYHLSKGMEVICLLYCDKLWINEKGLFYNLSVKEILITKETLKETLTKG